MNGGPNRKVSQDASMDLKQLSIKITEMSGMGVKQTVVHIISSHKSYIAEYKYIGDTCQQDRPKGVTSPLFQGLEASEISAQSRRRLNHRWHSENVARQEHIRKKTYAYSNGREYNN